MMLSERELHLPDEHDGIMVLGDGLRAGRAAGAHFALAQTCSTSR